MSPFVRLLTNRPLDGYTDLLEKQVKKFEWDYQVVKSKGFSFPREYFLWAWLVGK